RRVFDAPRVRRHDGLRSFLVAAWLGWQIESNWADPFLFAVYTIARPLASVLILVVMYAVITDSAFGQPIFPYIYLGNALYILVGQVITGVSWAVIDDREHYRVAKYLHTAPIDGYAYLFGRGVARLLIGTISVLIVIAFGMVLFRLPIRLDTVDWPLFLFSTALGVAALAGLGAIMGAWTMTMARHFWSVGEAVAGALYLFSGAIFPLDLLPAWLRPLGFALPVTYWLEAARRALLGPQAHGFPTLAGLTNAQLLGILAAFAVVLLVSSRLFYGRALHAAKERGLIDIETGY
ncbi:MAG: ABC transporter permease, partial [Anaerolineae bacterium]|nr:ABC transporter permease [Caldilineales bacterium]MDW8270558.1 ABC transporter permease [Anaerolineae bacterium]